MANSSAHCIRLREPWEREVVPGSNPDRAARVSFRRRFGQPTGLEPQDQIDLVLEQVAVDGQVWLNDERLGSIGAGPLARFPLRGRLRPRNHLLMEFDVPAGQVASTAFDGLIGEVRLEIRTAQE
jgi:hypothetical protein